VQAAVASDFGADGVQQIQKAQVDGMDLVGAMIPEDRVHGLDGIVVVLTVPAVADFQSLAGMGVEKPEGSFAPFARSGCGIQGLRQSQSGGQQGAQLKKASAGKTLVAGQPGMRSLRWHRFSHTCHPIARSVEVNGRSPSSARVRLVPFVPVLRQFLQIPCPPTNAFDRWL